MRVAGLTGGIASGKSTVSAMFRELGAPVIDADVISREVVEPGRPALAEIAAAFGPSVLLPDGRLDRGALGRMVFGDDVARGRLEAIVHPHVFAAEQERLEALRAQGRHPWAIVDAALLIEAGTYRRKDAVILVYVDESTQLARLQARDGLSRREALQRLAAQMPLKKKRRYADYIIDNGGDLDETRRQVQGVWAELKSRSEKIP